MAEIYQSDVGRVLAIQQKCQGGSGIGLPHQRFADEEGGVSGVFETSDVLGCADAAFGDLHGVRGYQWSELDQALRMYGEGSQVAAVDADQIEPEIDGALHLSVVVSLTEDVESHAV